MYWLSDLDFTLPFKNPVIIFSLVLFIILFAPLLFNKIKVPHIIGLILAGVVIGPYGFNLLLRDSSIVLFGTVGLLYIMFTAGLEIDLEEFRRNRLKSFVFGLFTFLIPLALGYFTAFYFLEFSTPSSLLLGSMFASHTLLAYPIVSKYGISRIRSVTLTIGGTIVTDILALLVLAGVIGVTQGEINTAFWIRLAVSAIIFGAIIFLLFPLIARWFFKNFEDSVSQYIFVLAMVFLGGFLAELAGLESIIGAFLAGLALNRFIPHSSALMNRIEFVGNAFFIPFFLISVGMLVDISVLFKGIGALKVAAIMTVLAIISKYIAAVFTQKTFRLSQQERRMIFGLSTARVGATLAVVLVGYSIIIGETPTGEPIRLLTEDVLNGTIVMILVTCTISSFIVEKTSQQLALKEEDATPAQEESNEKVLISIAYPETISELIDFGFMLRPKNSKIPVYALHIISDETNSERASVQGRKMMDKAVLHAAATENTLIPLTRFDMNISNGIIYTIKEQNITDVLIGLHESIDQKDFFGPTTERILKRTLETIYIYKSVQPFNTLKRMLVVVPPKAELEPGFKHWLSRLTGIAKEAGLPIIFYGNPVSLKELENQHQRAGRPVKTYFNKFSNWEDFLILGREVKQNDLFVIVSSRKGHVSYSTQQDKLPYFLTNYFNTSSYLILYPKQLDVGLNLEHIEQADSTLFETISEKMDVVNKAGNFLKKLLNKKGE